MFVAAFVGATPFATGGALEFNGAQFTAAGVAVRLLGSDFSVDLVYRLHVEALHQSLSAAIAAAGLAFSERSLLAFK